MKVLSLFDGISCGQIALERAGIKVGRYVSSEVDKHAIKVTQSNYPKTIQIGDVLDVKGLTDVDLLIGGSPCQGFSFAGKQLNFEDPRSKLFFEFVRILRECKPKYFLLENVVMKQEYQDIISEQLGVKPILINSSLVSAQSRKRLYWTNIPNVEAPEDKDIKWSKGFIASKRGRFLIDGKRQDGKQLTKGLTKQYIEFRYDGKSNTLTTVSKDNVIVDRLLKERILASEFKHRYLTGEEYEELQTIPIGYTESVSESQRKKLMGNAWTVDIIANIFKNIP